MMSAKLLVSGGSPVQCKPGETSSPSQVKRFGIGAPSEKPSTFRLKAMFPALASFPPWPPNAKHLSLSGSASLLGWMYQLDGAGLWPFFTHLFGEPHPCSNAELRKMAVEHAGLVKVGRTAVAGL